MTQSFLGIDVGGSSMKAGLVDVNDGLLISELLTVPTPQPSTPEALVQVMRTIAERLSAGSGRVGVAFPAVIKNGRAYTAANIDSSWIGTDGASLASGVLGRPVLFLNDADAAGMAEMRWGAGRNCQGTVVMLTFGTGIGSALFIAGKLFPNTELGHLEVHGMDAEKWASARVRTAEGLDFPSWCERVNEYLFAMHKLLWPDVFILGGAVSERFAEFAPLLRSPAELRPAHFANQAGIIGAALAAAEES